MRHVMLDLETLGKLPGCAILSIGAVYFELETGRLGDEFYLNVDPASCTRAGLTIDGETLGWWMQQEAAAWAAVCTEAVSIMDALASRKIFSIGYSLLMPYPPKI